jgi:hypothetical protein
MAVDERPWLAEVPQMDAFATTSVHDARAMSMIEGV